MKRVVFIFTWLLLSINSNAQNFADKNHFLVDSLDLSTITKGDEVLLDSCLSLFHQSKDDTTKINYINIIVEESWDDNVWPKYNNWVYEISKEQLNYATNEKLENWKTIANEEQLDDVCVLGVKV